MISYNGLETLLKEKGIGKTELSLELGLSTRTVAKIAKGEKLSKNTLNKIASYLMVTPESLYRIESDNKILQILRDEKEIHLVIEDSKKSFYYRGLSKWRNEKGWLIDTCHKKERLI